LRLEASSGQRRLQMMCDSRSPAVDYIRRWVPEPADVDAVDTLKSRRPPGYLEPIDDHADERKGALSRYRQIS
jgi:deoxyribodipyrimidine photo-lyase